MREPSLPTRNDPAELADALERRIVERVATVGVIGLGYVGLPLAIGFGRHGYRVIGIDLDVNKIAALRDGRSWIGDVSDEEVTELVGAGRFHASSDYELLAD